jgi:hypothetical protein
MGLIMRRGISVHPRSQGCSANLQVQGARICALMEWIEWWGVAWRVA